MKLVKKKMDGWMEGCINTENYIQIYNHALFNQILLNQILHTLKRYLMCLLSFPNREYVKSLKRNVFTTKQGSSLQRCDGQSPSHVKRFEDLLWSFIHVYTILHCKSHKWFLFLSFFFAKHAKLSILLLQIFLLILLELGFFSCSVSRKMICLPWIKSYSMLKVHCNMQLSINHLFEWIDP